MTDDGLEKKGLRKKPLFEKVTKGRMKWELKKLSILAFEGLKEYRVIAIALLYILQFFEY